MSNPLIKGTFFMEKYPGKGGWTYVTIPGVSQDKKARFGWVRVKGTIDRYPIKNYKLMPMGGGRLFLPIKTEIRKKIGKEAGDHVKIVLYADHDPLEIPEELLMCLKEEPRAYRIFLSFTESEQKGYIDWIYSAKREQTKADRIAKTIERTLQGLNLWERPE